LNVVRKQNYVVRKQNYCLYLEPSC